MKVTYVAMPREEVVTVLGPHWPPQPGALVSPIGAFVAIEHGAVAVHEAEGQPGTTWWAVDGLIVPQDAGPAPSLPGVVLNQLPALAHEAPPPEPSPAAP